MKNLSRCSLVIGTLLFCSLCTMVSAQQNQTQTNGNSPTSQSLRIGIVNTKRCLEESKFGKQEQANFEKMKNQMESVLHDKEATLEDIETKLNDDDYMDSISEEAANELRRKKRNIRNEGMQLQNQYLQTLQQTNLKIVQKLTEAIGKASAQIAQDTSSGQPLDAIFTDEACTFYAPHLDVTDRIIAKMNAIFDSEQKETPVKPMKAG
jgi:outer membrane protein